MQRKQSAWPSSLRFPPPVRSAKGKKLMVCTGFSFLKLRIDDCQFYTVVACVFSRSLSERSALISNSETSWVEELCCSKEQQTFIKQSEDGNSAICSVKGPLLVQTHL